MVSVSTNKAKVEDSSFSLLTEPSYLVNEDSIITWANEAFLQEFNLKSNNVIGKLTCEECCPSQLCGTKNCPVTKAKRLKKGAEGEYLHKRNGDTVTWYHTRATPMPEKGGTLINMRNITLIKQLQSQLQQMQTDLNVIPTPIMEIDDKFSITFMNPAGAAVAGMTTDEVIGKKCYDLFKTPHCKTEKCACAKAMKTDSVVTAQTIARPAEGIIIPIRYTASPIKDAKGNIKGALEYILDVTEEAQQKQAANEKIENLNAIPTPIMSVDTTFNITFMNPAGAAVLGLTPDEAIGKKCYELFKTSHCQTEKCAVGRAMREDTIVSEETIARPAEGVIIPIKYTGAPIKDAKGNIKGALEFVLDISQEVKQRQEANEKIENLNAIPTPILAVDLDLGITYINPAGAAMAGVTVEQAMGKKCWELFGTDHCKTKNCGVQQAISENSTVTEQTTAHINGKDIPVKITSVSIKDAKRNVKGGLEYMMDVTAEAEAERLINEASAEVESLISSLVSDSLLKMDEATSNMDAISP